MNMEEIARQREIEKELAAYRAQARLLESFVAMARSPGPGKLLSSALQTALTVVSDLADAEKGSLFLLDKEARVTESILTRKEASPETRSRLIGSVMSDGLAGWVVRAKEIGLIKDTRQDDRWLTLPDQPYQVRSALAAPILRAGKVLGLVTLLHSHPDHFTVEAAALVQAACDQFGLILENVGLYEKVSAYSQALDAQMEKGRRIQHDFLPKRLPSLSGWELAAFFEPTWQVSGDFYDAFELPGGRLGLVLADVSDKGVGAALFMALIRTLIRAFSGAASCEDGDFPTPEDSLKAVSLTNNYLARHHAEGGMFATIFMGVLDPESGRLDFVNAGHEPTIIKSLHGALRRLGGNGPAIGLLDDFNYQTGIDRLEPGDLLLGYTDGVTEAKSVDDRMFTRDRLERLLIRRWDSADSLLEGINVALKQHASGADQSDDITMLCLKRLEL
ncbi:MAG: GAF domain-containing SpoIIE family protein phosphatase [Pseudomonadota bacterium]